MNIATLTMLKVAVLAIINEWCSHAHRVRRISALLVIAHKFREHGDTALAVHGMLQAMEHEMSINDRLTHREVKETLSLIVLILDQQIDKLKQDALILQASTADDIPF